MKNMRPRKSPMERLSLELGTDRVRRDVALAPLTTFRIGGAADGFFSAQSPDELARAIVLARELEIPHVLIGRGANILVGDGGFRGLVIHSAAGGVEFLPQNRVRAGAGVDTYPDLVSDTVRRGLGGLHHFAGIPSSVGGALWQNLHFLSPGPERERTVFIAEVLLEADILTESGERSTVGADYFNFGYDYSILHDCDDVVLSATFQLEEADPLILRDIVRENLVWRKDRHPDLVLYPSAGSIFKKIEGVGAGRLIEQCGLKGHRIGGAGIFQKHANIIVNLGGATAADVRHLIDLARDTVQTETGHELRTEISFVGDF